MQDLVLRRIFLLIGLAILIWIVYLLKPIVIPFVGAFFIAYLFSPLVEALVKIKLPRWLAISLVFIGIGVGLTIILWFVVPLLWDQLVYARDSIPASVHWINATFLPWVSSTFNVIPMELDTDQITKTLMDYVQTNYSADSIQNMVLRLAQSGLNFIQIGGVVILIPVISFYFLLDWHKMLHNLQRLIPRRYETSTLMIIGECHRVLGAFVKGQFLVMLLLGIVYAIGLQLVGLELGIIIGMVAGLASIIPYLGFGVGIVAAIVASLFQFGLDWMQLLFVGIVFMVGQMVEGYILQPFLLGDKIGLSPVAVVFAVLAGAQLAGFLGMLIALPVAAVIVVLLKHVRNHYEKSHLYQSPMTMTSAQSDIQYIHVEAEHVELDLQHKNAQDTAHSVSDTEKVSKE